MLWRVAKVGQIGWARIRIRVECTAPLPVRVLRLTLTYCAVETWGVLFRNGFRFPSGCSECIYVRTRSYSLEAFRAGMDRWLHKMRHHVQAAKLYRNTSELAFAEFEFHSMALPFTLRGARKHVI